MIPQVRFALAIGSLLAAAWGGWAVNGWRLDSLHAAERAETAQTAAKVLAEAHASTDALTARLRAADDLHAAQLQKAQDETNRLRDRVSAGPVRLFVAAKCPAVPDLPQAASAPGVDYRAGAELDPSARLAYFALRDGIDRIEAKLAACQSELRALAEPVAH